MYELVVSMAIVTALERLAVAATGTAPGRDFTPSAGSLGRAAFNDAQENPALPFPLPGNSLSKADVIGLLGLSGISSGPLHDYLDQFFDGELRPKLPADQSLLPFCEDGHTRCLPAPAIASAIQRFAHRWENNETPQIAWFDHNGADFMQIDVGGQCGLASTEGVLGQHRREFLPYVGEVLADLVVYLQDWYASPSSSMLSARKLYPFLGTPALLRIAMETSSRVHGTMTRDSLGRTLDELDKTPEEPPNAEPHRGQHGPNHWAYPTTPTSLDMVAGYCSALRDGETLQHEADMVALRTELLVFGYETTVAVIAKRSHSLVGEVLTHGNALAIMLLSIANSYSAWEQAHQDAQSHSAMTGDCSHVVTEAYNLAKKDVVLHLLSLAVYAVLARVPPGGVTLLRHKLRTGLIRLRPRVDSIIISGLGRTRSLSVPVHDLVEKLGNLRTQAHVLLSEHPALRRFAEAAAGAAGTNTPGPGHSGGATTLDYLVELAVAAVEGRVGALPANISMEIAEPVVSHNVIGGDSRQSSVPHQPVP